MRIELRLQLRRALLQAVTLRRHLLDDLACPLLDVLHTARMLRRDFVGCPDGRGLLLFHLRAQFL